MRVERIEDSFAVEFTEHPYQPALSDARVAIGALALLPHEIERLGIVDPIEHPLVTAMDREMVKHEALYARYKQSKPPEDSGQRDFERRMTAEDLVLLRGALQLYYDMTPAALQMNGHERVLAGVRREGARIARNMKEVIDDQKIELEPIALELPTLEALRPGFYP